MPVDAEADLALVVAQTEQKNRAHVPQEQGDDLLLEGSGVREQVQHRWEANGRPFASRRLVVPVPAELDGKAAGGVRSFGPSVAAEVHPCGAAGYAPVSEREESFERAAAMEARRDAVMGACRAVGEVHASQVAVVAACCLDVPQRHSMRSARSETEQSD